MLRAIGRIAVLGLLVLPCVLAAQGGSAGERDGVSYVLADQKPALENEDLARLRDFGPPFPEPARHFIALSPDRQRIAFQIRQGDPNSNSYNLTMFVLTIKPNSIPLKIDEGGDLILQKVAGLDGTTSDTGLPDTIAPIWSADSKAVYFLKRIGGSTQIWRASADGTDSRQVTHEDGDVSDLAWSADGKRILYSGLHTSAEKRALLAQEALRGYQFDERFVPLSADRLGDGLAVQPFVSSMLPGSGSSTPASKGDAVFLAKRTDDPWTPAAALSADNRLAWLERDGSAALGRPMRLFAENSDHKVSECEASGCSDANNIWWTSGGTKVGFMRREGWGDSKTAIYAWEPGNAEPKRLYETTDLLLDCQSVGEKLLCVREQSNVPRQIILLDPESGRAELIYDPNPDFSKFALGRVERLQWLNAFGIQTFGDLVYPVGYKRGNAYPLIVVQYISRGFLRGGIGDEFPVQVFANRGYAVLSIQRPNLRKFIRDAKTEAEIERKLLANFKDRRSVLSSIELGVGLLIKRGIADRTRIGITGLSDGSSTVQFAAINSNMFKVGSASGCCWDQFQDAYLGSTTATAFHDMGWPPLIDYPSKTWDQMSLVSNARRIKLPLLIQQADDEYRGALSSFTALREAGKPAALYVFPNEFHNIWQPAHRLAAYRRNLQWFDFWLNNHEDENPVDPSQYPEWRAMRDKP